MAIHKTSARANSQQICKPIKLRNLRYIVKLGLIFRDLELIKKEKDLMGISDQKSISDIHVLHPLELYVISSTIISVWWPGRVKRCTVLFGKFKLNINWGIAYISFLCVAKISSEVDSRSYRTNERSTAGQPTRA